MDYNYNMGSTYDNQYLSNLKKQNEALRKTANKVLCLKVKRVMPDASVMGGYIVYYFDYRTRCDNYAAINDVLYWVQIGEIYVDNLVYLLSFIQ